MTILCYHSVDPRWQSSLAVHPDDFERQCAWLWASGRVAPLGQLLERRPLRGPERHGSLALTFDDGLAELYDHAFPTLRRFRLPAVIFVVARTLTGARQPVDWVDTPPAWPLKTLTVDQVLEARSEGLQIASHSYAHQDLTQLSEQECLDDLRLSREVLEDVLREQVRWLAYPGGRHAAHVRRAAQRAGFSHGFTLPDAREARGPFSIPRVGVFPGNGVLGLRAKTSLAYLPIRTSPVFPVMRRLVRQTTAAAGPVPEATYFRATS